MSVPHHTPTQHRSNPRASETGDGETEHTMLPTEKQGYFRESDIPLPGLAPTPGSDRSDSRLTGTERVYTGVTPPGVLPKRNGTTRTKRTYLVTLISPASTPS